MSLNTAHINGGVLIHGGECILLFADKVVLVWSDTQHTAFRGEKKGRIYLTTHRMIFNSSSDKDEMQSFSFPFVTLSNVELEQPVFGANYIKGTVRAQPNGNWIGSAKFKLTFKHGGAIEFGQAMLKAASLATRELPASDSPPPYTPPGNWYAAPPPAYAPAANGYYGWVPPTHTFPNQPPRDGVFMTDAPPPYPGINAPGGGKPSNRVCMNDAPPPYPGIDNPRGAAGFSKAAEAAQSAYYDPNQPQMAYVPPPAYYETPPSYNQATDKKYQ